MEDRCEEHVLLLVDRLIDEYTAPKGLAPGIGMNIHLSPTAGSSRIMRIAKIETYSDTILSEPDDILAFNDGIAQSLNFFSKLLTSGG